MPEAPIATHQEITKGDSYKAAESRALKWWASWYPNLAGSTLTMTVGYDDSNIYGSSPVVWTQVVPSTPSPVSTASIELSSVETEQLNEGDYDYTVTAKLADGDVFTLAADKISVLSAPGEAPLAPIETL